MLQWLCCCSSRRRTPESTQTDDPSPSGSDEHTPLISSRHSNRTESTNWSPRSSPSLSFCNSSTSSSASSEDMVLTPGKNGGPSVAPRTVPTFTPITPKLTRVSFPHRRRQDEAPTPRQTTCTARLASLFNAQTRHPRMPVLLFLSLEWVERLRISKTCKLYYKLWYMFDFSPRIMHDGAFGAQVKITPVGMAYRCVIDMDGRKMKNNFEAVTTFSEPARVSCDMEIYPGNTIRRFLPGVLDPSMRKGLKRYSELELPMNGTQLGYTPSGCILWLVQWIPARHPPEQDGVIETWTIGPDCGSISIRDLVQIATLQNPKDTHHSHAVEGFTPLRDRPFTWSGLDRRPYLPELPPGRFRIIFKTEDIEFAPSQMCLLKQAAQHIIAASQPGGMPCTCSMPC